MPVSWSIAATNSRAKPPISCSNPNAMFPPLPSAPFAAAWPNPWNLPALPTPPTDRFPQSPDLQRIDVVSPRDRPPVYFFGLEKHLPTCFRPTHITDSHPLAVYYYPATGCAVIREVLYEANLAYGARQRLVSLRRFDFRQRHTGSGHVQLWLPNST